MFSVSDARDGAPEGERPLFVAFSNTVAGVFALALGLTLAMARPPAEDMGRA